MVELKEKRLRKSLSEAKNHWQGQKDSNPRHADFQSAALPTELPDRIRGNGFRFDASIYSSGYSSQTQELFYLCRVLSQ